MAVAVYTRASGRCSGEVPPRESPDQHFPMLRACYMHASSASGMHASEKFPTPVLAGPFTVLFWRSLVDRALCCDGLCAKILSRQRKKTLALGRAALERIKST